MNIITNDLIFNDRTLNIFTDASIIKTDTNETIGCAGNNIIVNNTKTIFLFINQKKN